MTSGTDPRRKATAGVPQAIASISANPNGSGQSIGNNSGIALPKNLLFVIADLGEKIDYWIVQKRLHFIVEIVFVKFVDLRRDNERHPGAAGDLDCPIRPLLGADPADEGKISAITGAGCIEARRNPMVNGAMPIRQGTGLRCASE